MELEVNGETGRFCLYSEYLLGKKLQLLISLVRMACREAETVAAGEGGWVLIK